MPERQLSFAVVCSSNMNRSMEAHRILKKKEYRLNQKEYISETCKFLKNFTLLIVEIFDSTCPSHNVTSYGTGAAVKIPGPSADRPNIYSFDWTYDKIHKDLCKKDIHTYTENGILSLLDRNRRIKKNPEKFQLSKGRYDVVFTAEERVYDQAIERK